MKTPDDLVLLKRAAKSLGEGVITSDHWDRGYTFFMDGGTWDPLTDDGDALRLAVKLQMSVGCDDYADAVVVYTRDGNDSVRLNLADSDRYAVTRRAIVMAAAAYKLEE